MRPLPDHYRTALRDLIRLSMLGIAAALLLGVWWTTLRKNLHFSPDANGEAQPVEVAHPKTVEKGVELPPGMVFEAGLDLKLSHGHVALLGGLVPMGFAAALYLSFVCGGSEIRKKTLDVAFWLYAVGAGGALALMVYKGYAQFEAVLGGQFDLSAIDRGLFNGSRAIRGACYGISHTILAVGAFIYIVVLFRSVNAIRRAEADADAT
jgi:hypothetical protein